MSPDNKPKIMTAQDLVSFGDLPTFLFLSLWDDHASLYKLHFFPQSYYRWVSISHNKKSWLRQSLAQCGYKDWVINEIKYFRYLNQNLQNITLSLPTVNDTHVSENQTYIFFRLLIQNEKPISLSVFLQDVHHSSFSSFKCYFVHVLGANIFMFVFSYVLF